MVRKQWSAAQFAKQRSQKLGNAPTKDVWLYNLRTSSTDTINQLLNEIAETIPMEPGLESFKVNGCWEENPIDQWPI